MNCTINRLTKSEHSTQGTFEVNGQLKYYTMEPANPIPAGTYQVGQYASPKHKMQLVPILLNVPGHSYVEVHIVNKPADTLDCLGLAYGPIMKDWQSNSGQAITDFYKIFFACLKDNEKVYFTYKDF